MATSLSGESLPAGDVTMKNVEDSVEGALAEDWLQLADDVLRETDVAYEEELRRNPFGFKVWWSYLESKKAAPPRLRFLIYERALKVLPRSYKLWWNYLQELMDFVSKDCITSRGHSSVNSVYERCMVHQSKMPRLWLDYCGFLEKQKLITRCRRMYDRALVALPITQHRMIWDRYIQFVKDAGVVETALVVFRRYLMLQPEHGEVYIAYLLSIGHYDEAATRLAAIVDDEEFVSMEGKPKHKLWMELCEIIARHPKEVTSFRVEPVLRGGIAKFTDQVGRLWCSLAEHFILLGSLEKARDVYEEALISVGTLQDFSLVFDAYMLFAEGLVTRRGAQLTSMQQAVSGRDVEELTVEVDMMFTRLEDLLDRRPELVSSVKLRQNPHNVHEWLNRTKLFADDPTKVVRTFTEAVLSIDPHKAVGKLHVLWILFSRFYEEHGDIVNAEVVYEKATRAKFRGVDDLASVWCDWVEMELRHKRYDKALEVVRKAIDRPRPAMGYSKDDVQTKLYRSVKLWSFCADVEESLGSLDTTRACYDKMFELKVITPQIVLNYAYMLEEKKYFEESFKTYEKAIAIFKWPHVDAIWMTYLTKFVQRFKGKKLERGRELFEQAIADVPAKHARRLYLMYAALEEDHGLARHALRIYHRATSAVETSEMFGMYMIYICKSVEFLGVLKSRPIFAEAIEKLPNDKDVREMCLRQARVERGLGEIDRARAVYQHAAQFCDPRRDVEFWKQWREFEVAHGSEDTFRDMLRVKRSVQAQFSHTHFNLAEGASALGLDVDEVTTPQDAMAAAEAEADEEKRKRQEAQVAAEATRLKKQKETDDLADAEKAFEQFQALQSGNS